MKITGNGAKAIKITTKKCGRRIWSQTAHTHTNTHWMPKIWLTFHLNTRIYNIEHEMIILLALCDCSISSRHKAKIAHRQMHTYDRLYLEGGKCKRWTETTIWMRNGIEVIILVFFFLQPLPRILYAIRNNIARNRLQL